MNYRGGVNVLSGPATGLGKKRVGSIGRYCLCISPSVLVLLVSLLQSVFVSVGCSSQEFVRHHRVNSNGRGEADVLCPRYKGVEGIMTWLRSLLSWLNCVSQWADALSRSGALCHGGSFLAVPNSTPDRA
jgi:hypothetical protein